jgi:DNA-binding NarL/FixJ family response regulator
MQQNNSKEKITVVIVDDNADLRDALERIVNRSEDCLLIGTCDSCEEATIKIPELQPHVVVMDINLGGLDGISCVRNVKRKHPHILFLMCTVHEEDEKIFLALSAGASGYILKNTAHSKLIEAIKELVEGGAPMSGQIARKVVEAFRTPAQVAREDREMSSLTTREVEILSMLAKGMVYKEIAEKLFVSAETVRKHAYNIYDKLHVKNRMEAANKYYRR